MYILLDVCETALAKETVLASAAGLKAKGHLCMYFDIPVGGVRLFSIQGLSSFLYKDEPSVTLVIQADTHTETHTTHPHTHTHTHAHTHTHTPQVSNGAEVVMLSKYFLHQHFKEATRDRLKRQVKLFILKLYISSLQLYFMEGLNIIMMDILLQITQFPSQEMMLKRIREHYS